MRKILLATLLGAAICAMTGTALAGVFGFDTIPPFTVPPPGYAGISTWDGSIQSINADCCNGTMSGYFVNNVSPPNEGFDPFGNPADLGSPTDPTFTLSQFYTGAAWNDGEDLHIVGLLNGVPVAGDDVHVTISAIGPAQLVVLNWSGINQVDFTPSGGTNHGWNGSGEHFIIDDLCINGGCGGQTTPEPGTLVMLGSGVVGLAGLLRRKVSL
jgi:hypothetical protein